MDKPTKLWANHTEAVFYITLILFVIGTVNVFSASFVLAGQLLHDSYFFLKRHMVFFLIGFVAMLIIGRMNYHILRKFVVPIGLATIGLLVAVHFGGAEANGARRWLDLAGIKFQPSEIAKLAVVIITANYLGPRLDRNRKIDLFSAPLWFSFITFGFVLKQPDMGTAMIIIGLCLLIYLIAGLPRHQIALLVCGGTAAVVMLSLVASYRADRIYAWLNPWAYQDSIGYQTVQSLMAIGSGGLWGTGLGMGTSKFYYLPEAHTDFAFAVLCQEMGFIGAGIVLVLLALLGIYGAKIAAIASDGFGKLLAIGAIGIVVGQGVINIAMVSGLLPVVGVPLPFISFGGTSLVVNFCAIGLLISVSRRATVKKRKEDNQPPPAPKKLRLVTPSNS